jgi:hypothetical protein
LGMYDYLKCEYPLPNPPYWITEETIFQTKHRDEDCCMETFRITKEGRLIHQRVSYVNCPDEERPYWGKPEWNKSEIYRMAGMIKTVPAGDVDTEFHGDIVFYEGSTIEENKWAWYEVCARFTNGKLEWIKEVKKE